MRSPLKAGLVMMRVAHLVHQVEHLLVAGVGVLGDAVELQRLGRAAAALVQCRDEARAGLGLLELIGVHVCPFCFTGNLALP